MAVLKIPPTEARAVIAYSENPDGTLSPTNLSKAPITTPIINPTRASRTQFFSQKGDGTLSPETLS